MLYEVGGELRSCDYQISEFDFDRNFEIKFHDRSDSEINFALSYNEIPSFTDGSKIAIEIKSSVLSQKAYRLLDCFIVFQAEIYIGCK